MMTTHLDEQAAVGDLVTEYPQIRPVLERYGIDYCCGGQKDLKTAAAARGLNPAEVRAALEAAVDEAPADADDRRNWAQAEVGELVDHIESRHHTFMKEQLPRLQQLLSKVQAAHDEKHGPMLTELGQVYDGLRAEIEAHLQKEEEILFPFIRQIEAFVRKGGPEPAFHCGTLANPIRQMEHEHDNAGAALTRMRELTDDYTPPADACNTFTALYDGLKALEDDLHRHIHLENNVLFPKTLELERQTATPSGR